MKYISLLLLLLLPFTLASPSPTTRDAAHKHGTPVRTFTVAAFQSPYPPGNGSISGLAMTARFGSFWLNPHPPNQNSPAVLWVDAQGQAWLDPANPQQVYMDTQTGILSYVAPKSKLSPGALITNFLHLGEGKVVAVPIPSAPGFYNAGPGTFQWIGGDSNAYWFACPRPGPGYQVMKFVGGLNDWNSCVSGVQLVALDV